MLRDLGADVLVSYLPVGSELAVRFYADAPFRPVSDSSTPFRCSSPAIRMWARKFYDAGVPIIGDDIKSQGATIVHRQPARLFEDRGVVVERMSQPNVGGNMDFKNMLERERPRVEEGLKDAGRHLAV